MRAHEFILNEKRRKKRKARSVAGPYYGYYYGLGATTDSGAEGGDGGGVEEGELIPWPKGTVKVDVSDVYDWYKLGQHISNLKGLGKHDFGKGPPQTVMAFGSEPLEHEYIKDLNKIGLKTYDIDEDKKLGVAEEAENYGGIQLSLDIQKDDEYLDDEDTDNQTIYVTATSNGRELGHVLFTIDYDSKGMVLNPQDLEVDERFRGQGIAATMYDYVKSKGYRIRRSGQQTDAGVGFWAKHRPEQNVWEQNLLEGKMAELDMDLEDPEISDRQFEKIYGMTRKEARELFSRTNMWDFPQVRDPDRPLHEQGVAEAVHPDIISGEKFSSKTTPKVKLGDFMFTASLSTGGNTNPDAKGLQITAYDSKNSRKIGWATFIVKSDRKGNQWLESDDTEVDDRYQGKGVATMMYAFAKSLGNDIQPSPLQSYDGLQMWLKWGKDAKHLVGEQGVAEGNLNESAIFLNPNTVIVGQEHGKPLKLSPEISKRVQAIAKKHGAWYEGNGMDQKLTKGIIDDYRGSWDDDLLSPSIKGYPYPFLYVLFSNIKANDTVKGKIGSDPKVTIFYRILNTQPSTNYFPDRTFSSEDLTKFLKSVSQGKYDFVKMSKAPATEKNVQRFFTIGEKLMWPENWEEYPNRAGQLAKRVNDLRDKFLASRKSGVYVVGSSHLIAVKNFANKQGVAESLDSPYSYHWEEGDFGDLNAYAKLSDNTVLDIEFEQINVDKSQWTVGFQRDGQIHKTGKGDEQRVFATVLSAIKEFIENKQPKEVFFSAEKSEVNPESRKRLYDRLVQKYATALGYQASQSETNWGTKYKFLRIREQGVAEGNNNLNFEEGDCPIFAIALHRLSKLPLMALVEYDEEMGSTVLIHAYVKLNDEWRVDASGETNVPHMLAKFPNNGSAEEVQISEKDLIKLGYEKNKCPSLSEVLPYAKKILQDIEQGVTEGSPQPGESSGKAKQFNPNAKIQTKEMTLDQILNTVKGIPYVNEVIQDWDAKDYSWGVTKKVIEYAQYLQQNPQSVANLPPLVVIDGQLNDGAHRLSAINLLQKRMDPKNPLWKQVKLKVKFGTSADVASEQGVAEGNLTEFAPGPDFRDDDNRQDMPLLEFAKIIKLFLGSEYTMIDRKTPEQVSVKFDPKDRTSGHNGAVLYSVVRKQNEYPTVNFQLIDYEQGPQVGRGRRAGTAILKTRANALKIADIIYNTMGLPQQDRRVEENFADGRNPGRKGLAKRMGVPTKASVSRLRQIAKSSSGEKQRMAHWLANMKAGRKK